MAVIDFNGLTVRNAHFSDFSAIGRKIGRAFEVVEKFCKLDLDVLEGLVLTNPLGQLTLHFLSIQISSLVYFVLLSAVVEYQVSALALRS
jgi:hypothetical protein